jgi:predicted exporter
VAVLAISVLVALACGYVGMQLPLRSDLSTLLPRGQRSVQDLEALKLRAQPFGTVHVVVEAEAPALREAAATGLRARLARLGRDDVVSFSPDDGPLYRYAWQHRFLLAKLADLEAARDALRARIERAKLAKNPLFIQLDDERPAGDADRLTELEQRLADLERKAASPPPRAGQDGRIELLVVQTAFSPSDHARARALVGRIELAIEEVRREVGPGVRIGLTGNAPTTLHEHDSVLEGMAISIAVTVALCAIALWLYYRSGRLVLAMLWSLAVGVAATFALAYALIGHLDMMSAFLAAIVIGNGINPALVLVARYLEEVRGGRAPEDAVAPALAGALPGTLAAAVTAGVAYLSLLVTDFLGFRHFGAIAGAGMALTWLTTFTVLPALLLVLARRGAIRATRPPAVGLVLSKLLPGRHGLTVAFGAVLTALAAAITTWFIARDPFTKDWRALQSTTSEIRQARALDAKLRAALDSRSLLAGQAYQVALAVQDRRQLAPLIARLRAEAPPWLHDVRSLDDLVPPDQAPKLAVLDELRRLIDDDALQASLEPAERARLAKVRPPDDVRPIGDADVPHDLIWPFVERDGTIGRLALLRGSSALDSFNVDDRLRFAHEVRALELPPGTLAAGESLVVANIIETMERDAPWMVGVSLVGSVIAVLLVIGLRRHGLVTLACGLAGVLLMVAMCALAGLSVHFLDLIALPITIGIGIDYAVNLAARDREEGERGPRHLLATTGGAVLLCSYTTAVGYSTLLLSANGGIRAFGLAALLGETACIAMALLIAPALLALLRARAGRP